MQQLIKYSLLMLVVVLLSACSAKKFLPEGKLFYEGAKLKLSDTVKIDEKAALQQELTNVLKQPNGKFLGMRPGVYFYYKAQREKPGFLNKFFNKQLGEEPVYLSDVDLATTEALLLNRLANNGFFNSRVVSEIQEDTTARSAQVQYELSLENPYRIEQFQLEKDSLDSLQIYTDIQKSLSETLIKKGKRFNLNTLKSERERIDTYLKNKGYYNFNADFLLFEADTNQYDKRKVDLFLSLKNNIPKKSKHPYVIDDVLVYPNAKVGGKRNYTDTTTVDGIHFMQDSLVFKPKRLEPYLLIRPGDTYNPQNSSYTSRRLSSIGTYKFVNIQYKETDTLTDSLGRRHLKAIVDLSPLNKRSIRLELQGVTKSNNFAGPGIGVTYSNRNLFQGGELLQLSGNFGYEQQFFGGNQPNNTNSIQLGVNSSLLFPRLLFPVPIDTEGRFRYSIPKTKVDLGVDYLNRSRLYRLTSFSTSFGYIWAANRFITHELTPININYVSLGNTSPTFEAILDDNPFLRRSFEQQFIAGLTYSFTYSQMVDPQRIGSLYFGFNFDIAGNTIDLFSKQQPDGPNTFLGLAYAQYAKADIDLRYHYKLDDAGQKLVGRLFGGLGVPYGNSEALPFVKQYFSGGPYSVRAFRIRSLGPGSYQPEDNSNAFFDQAGDIRLEANVEYRFPIMEYLNGAVFADAGNVWLLNKNEALPGGQFSSDFVNEFGVGAGIGLRVDIQGFVIRLDLASPLKRPTKTWNFEYDNPVFNFAIGYPF